MWTTPRHFFFFGLHFFLPYSHEKLDDVLSTTPFLATIGEPKKYVKSHSATGLCGVLIRRNLRLANPMCLSRTLWELDCKLSANGTKRNIIRWLENGLNVRWCETKYQQCAPADGRKADGAKVLERKIDSSRTVEKHRNRNLTSKSPPHSNYVTRSTLSYLRCRSQAVVVGYRLDTASFGHRHKARFVSEIYSDHWHFFCCKLLLFNWFARLCHLVSRRNCRQITSPHTRYQFILWWSEATA